MTDEPRYTPAQFAAVQTLFGAVVAAQEAVRRGDEPARVSEYLQDVSKWARICLGDICSVETEFAVPPGIIPRRQSLPKRQDLGPLLRDASE